MNPPDAQQPTYPVRSPAPGYPPRRPAHRTITPVQRLHGIGVLLVGACTVVLLTRYNMAPWSIWSVGQARGLRSWDEYLLVNITALILPPMILILGLFRANPEKFGMRPPSRGAGALVVVLFALMLPVLLIAARQNAFTSYYPLQPAAAYSLKCLLMYELTYGFYMFCWEFFYRGFLTQGLAIGFGTAAALILPTIAFGLMHYGKPMPEFIGAFPAGLILGWIALRTKSFYPCFVLHWGVSLTFDLLCIHARPGTIF